MNIVEAYIEKYKSLVLIISGMAGCNKTSYAKIICSDLKLKYIDQSEYYKKDYDNKITINNVELQNIYTDDAIDWDKLNDEVEKYKNQGVVLTGISFPTNLLTFKVDYHIHLTLSKIECMEVRKQFISKHQEQYPIEYDFIHSPDELTRMNKYIMPYYLESKEKMHINKFIKLKSKPKNEILDDIWNMIIEFIESKIY